MTPEQHIRQAVQALADAWNVHDATAFAAVFQERADFTNVFGMKATGRDTIAQFHAPIFATMFKDSHLRTDDVEVRFIRPDVAVVDVHWSMSGARDPEGKPWPDRDGLMTLVMTSDGGRWGIAVMHNMDLPSPQLREAQARVQRINTQ